MEPQEEKQPLPTMPPSGSGKGTELNEEQSEEKSAEKIPPSEISMSDDIEKNEEQIYRQRLNGEHA